MKTEHVPFLRGLAQAFPQFINTGNMMHGTVYDEKDRALINDLSSSMVNALGDIIVGRPTDIAVLAIQSAVANAMNAIIKGNLNRQGISDEGARIIYLTSYAIFTLSESIPLIVENLEEIPDELIFKGHELGVVDNSEESANQSLDNFFYHLTLALLIAEQITPRKFRLGDKEFSQILDELTEKSGPTLA